MSYFKIDRVQGEAEIFNVEKTLKQDDAHNEFSKFDTDSEQQEFNGRDRKRGNEEISEQSIGRIRIIENQPDPDFCQDDNDVQTKIKTTTKYSNAKVKTRNLLTNVSYRRYKPEDIEKTNFIIDVFLFLTQKLNPTGIDIKLKTSRERDYRKIIWAAMYHINSASLFIKNKILLSVASRI